MREIGVVILGQFTGIEEGTTVRRTGEILSVPVGDAFLGRVVDALGRPIDGKGEIKAEATRALELQAPSVVQRQPVKEPLATGIKAIDAMTAIGRGQRQLIIGDRQTGKTAVAIDTIINQRDNWKSGDKKKQVKCIYVAIGQKGSTIASVKAALEEAGAMEYTTIVAAPASDPAGFKYLAPYTGSAIGQHWMYNGGHVLIVFDDLSKQAEAYRSVSLLLRRPPGREAYPGDVFYLHSRLLERCAKLSDDMGGGSMTGLPIIETKGHITEQYRASKLIDIYDTYILEKKFNWDGVICEPNKIWFSKIKKERKAKLITKPITKICERNKFFYHCKDPYKSTIKKNNETLEISKINTLCLNHLLKNNRVIINCFFGKFAMK